MNVADEKSEYLTIWRNILVLGGWMSASDFSDWLTSTGYESSLDDPESPLYHLHPQEWVVPAIVPTGTYKRIGVDSAMRLNDALLDYLDKDWSSFAHWGTLKPDVESLIARHTDVVKRQITLTLTGATTDSQTIQVFGQTIQPGQAKDMRFPMVVPCHA
jgi:hypothetical protein